MRVFQLPNTKQDVHQCPWFSRYQKKLELKSDVTLRVVILFHGILHWCTKMEVTVRVPLTSMYVYNYKMKLDEDIATTHSQKRIHVNAIWTSRRLLLQRKNERKRVVQEITEDTEGL